MRAGMGASYLLVYLQIPGSTTGPYRAFREALGPEAVGWVGRNISLEDLANAEAMAGFKIVGGRFPLARFLTLPKVTAVTAMVNGPVGRALAQWNEAVGEFSHPHHDATQTFMQRELFEENHPFAQSMSNVATRFFMPDEETPPSAKKALEAIKGRRCIIAEPPHTRPFCNVLSRLLDLPPGSIDEAGFRAPPVREPARGELLRLIRAANEEDIALLKGLRELIDGPRPVVRTKAPRGGGKGARKAAAKD